uniref:Putative secreted protein synganglion overexpressed n=1 Tax=Rhipicephalus microplus TaxID=6941 RepID=A0A6M2DB04_RHIMP
MYQSTLSGFILLVISLQTFSERVIPHFIHFKHLCLMFRANKQIIAIYSVQAAVGERYTCPHLSYIEFTINVHSLHMVY